MKSSPTAATQVDLSAFDEKFPSLDQFENLAERVSKLESNHDKMTKEMSSHLQTTEEHADRITKLENAMTTFGEGDKIDAAQIMMRISMLAEELKLKVTPE